MDVIDGARSARTLRPSGTRVRSPEGDMDPDTVGASRREGELG
jgi:hypothetical protein